MMIEVSGAGSGSPLPAGERQCIFYQNISFLSPKRSGPTRSENCISDDPDLYCTSIIDAVIEKPQVRIAKHEIGPGKLILF